MSTIFDNDIAVLNYAENRRPREDPESLLPSVLPYRSTLTGADDSPGSPGAAKADSSVSGRGRSASLLDQIGNSLGLGGGAGADKN
jgi:hypothetical protein